LPFLRASADRTSSGSESEESINHDLLAAFFVFRSFIALFRFNALEICFRLDARFLREFQPEKQRTTWYSAYIPMLFYISLKRDSGECTLHMITRKLFAPLCPALLAWYLQNLFPSTKTKKTDTNKSWAKCGQFARFRAELLADLLSSAWELPRLRLVR
jgi:hypothetical protein